METSLTGILISIGTIALIVLMQMSFWFPMGITKKQRTNTSTAAADTSTDNATATATALMKEKTEVDKKEDIISNEQQSSCIIIPNLSFRNKTSNESNELLSNESGRDKNEKEISNSSSSSSSSSLDKKGSNDEVKNNIEENEEDWFKMNDGSTKKTGSNNNNNNWRCACEFGFLPAGMLKTFGNAEAIAKLGIGQCYHKQ